jgi:predicted nucleic acid-binding protein
LAHTSSCAESVIRAFCDRLRVLLTSCLQLTGPAIGIESDISSIRETLKTARNFLLTDHDSVYVALAIKEDIPLATMDKELALAAAKAGVAVL